MKKRRKVTSNLDEKIHLGYHKDSSEENAAAECGQVTYPQSTERPTPEALQCYQELPPSPDQRKLLSSLQYQIIISANFVVDISAIKSPWRII